MQHIAVINDLKEKGFRITKVRRTVLDILYSTTKPISVQNLLKNLLLKDISANKTTIYREIEFLKYNNLIKEVDFGDRVKRYEVFDISHHHHIMCLTCGHIEDIDFDVDLTTHESDISQKTGFKIADHSIEFFGYCKTCQ